MCFSAKHFQIRKTDRLRVKIGSHGQLALRPVDPKKQTWRRTSRTRQRALSVTILLVEP
jgi:hypothetical protein